MGIEFGSIGTAELDPSPTSPDKLRTSRCIHHNGIQADDGLMPCSFVISETAFIIGSGRRQPLELGAVGDERWEIHQPLTAITTVIVATSAVLNAQFFLVKQVLGCRLRLA